MLRLLLRPATLRVPVLDHGGQGQEWLLARLLDESGESAMGSTFSNVSAKLHSEGEDMGSMLAKEQPKLNIVAGLFQHFLIYVLV